ncbi:MAG: four helix bundle protein [Phycisphaeraceae bacterium]
MERGGFDLEERTAAFGEAVIDFALALSVTPVTRSLIDQLVRAGTSIGANYCEANEADTKREFRYRINLCRRESKETRHWLRMIVRAVTSAADDARLLWRESDELARIFATIHRSSAPKPT